MNKHHRTIGQIRRDLNGGAAAEVSDIDVYRPIINHKGKVVKILFRKAKTRKWIKLDKSDSQYIACMKRQMKETSAERLKAAEAEGKRLLGQ